MSAETGFFPRIVMFTNHWGAAISNPPVSLVGILQSKENGTENCLFFLYQHYCFYMTIQAEYLKRENIYLFMFFSPIVLFFQPANSFLK